MKRYPLFFLICMMLALGGCLSFPKSSSELVQTASTVKSYCYSENKNVIEKRIQFFLKKTYRDELSIRKVSITNGTRISLINHVGVGYSAEIISQTEGCETKVTMYGASFFWKSIFKMIDKAAMGEEAKWSPF